MAPAARLSRYNGRDPCAVTLALAIRETPIHQLATIEMSDHEKLFVFGAGVVAIGDNGDRMKIASWLIERGCRHTAMVHPAAPVGRDVEIGEGTVVTAGYVINSGVRAQDATP